MCHPSYAPSCSFILQVFLVVSDTSQRDSAAKTRRITYLQNAGLDSKVLRYFRPREMNGAYKIHTIRWKALRRWNNEQQAACFHFPDAALCPRRHSSHAHRRGILVLCTTLWPLTLSPASWAATVKWPHISLHIHTGINNIIPGLQIVQINA